MRHNRYFPTLWNDGKKRNTIETITLLQPSENVCTSVHNKCYNMIQTCFVAPMIKMSNEVIKFGTQ